MLDTYGISPGQLVSGEIPPLLALVYIYRLRENSRYATELRGGIDFEGWTVDRYLAAHNHNVLQGILYVLMKTNSKGGVKKPQFYEPPTPKKQRGREDDNGFAAMTAKARANRARRERQE